MTLKNKRIEWKVRYDAWKESGQSVAAWCRDQEIKVHQMYYWVKQFERGNMNSGTPAQTQWLTVQVDEEINHMITSLKKLREQGKAVIDD